MASYLYLHGFASSPQSNKAKYLSQRFQAQHLYLHSPDLNQGDFQHLTLTRQIHQVSDDLIRLAPSHVEPVLAPGAVARGEKSVVLIGSSFGGLTAAWVAERHAQIERIVLLAPAFRFLDCWLPKLGAKNVQHWQTSGYLPIYHYRDRALLPLHYHFIEDLQTYDETALQRPIPTLIIHGQHDETIPIQSSREYAAARPWVELLEVDSDHSLGNVLDLIWQQLRRFCL